MPARHSRHPYVDAKPAHFVPGFVAWGWTGWIGGVFLWFLYLYFTYPTASALYRGELGPMPLLSWVVTSLQYVFVFSPPLLLAIYVAWVFFIVIRVSGDRITVGRWFGVRQVTYSSTDIIRWWFIGWRSREVPDGKRAWRIRVDFSDGSWVRLSRFAWNFRRLEAWLRERTPVASSGSAGSHTRPSTFVVRDVRVALYGIAAWVIFWVMSGMAILLTLALWSGTVSITGRVGSYAYLVVMGMIGLFIGPYVASRLSYVVRVDAPHIHVHRWWGLSRRTYREDDIKSWRVSLDPNPPWWRAQEESKLVIRFTKGGSLVVMGQAANFHALHAYLRDRLAPREQVLPVREKRRAA